MTIRYLPRTAMLRGRQITSTAIAVQHQASTAQDRGCGVRDRLIYSRAAMTFGSSHVDVAGEHGTALRDVWRDGAQAYLGMAVPGFPNFFMLYGPNTNVGSNSVLFVLEAQARYIVRALKHMRRRRSSYLAVRPEAMAAFVAKIDRWMAGTVWTTRCSNYFRVASGRVVTQWPRSARAFWAMTRRFRSADFLVDPPAVPVVHREARVTGRR